MFRRRPVTSKPTYRMRRLRGEKRRVYVHKSGGLEKIRIARRDLRRSR